MTYLKGVQVKRNQVHELEKLMWIELVKVRMYIQANLCQKLLFRHQLPKLQYDKRLFIMKLRVQYIKITNSEHVVCINYFFCFYIQKTLCTQHLLSLQFSCTEQWYFGLVDARIRASDKDLPVRYIQSFLTEFHRETKMLQEKCFTFLVFKYNLW